MAQIWGDILDAASMFETRVGQRLADKTPSNWILISGSNQSYTGKKDTKDIDLILFSQNNCFLIEVKGGDVEAITDDKWVIRYHGGPPGEIRLFKNMLKNRNILHSKLKTRNYALNGLPVIPIVCCYDKVFRTQDRIKELDGIDKGNREMVVGESDLIDKINEYEKASTFQSKFSPAEMAKKVFTPYEFKVPEISFEDLEIFRRAHEFIDQGKEEEYANIVYRKLGLYFKYIIVKIAEAAQTKISRIHGENVVLYPYLSEESKLSRRSFAFFPFVRYPEVDYVDYAQLGFDFGYFDEGLIESLDIKGVLPSPTYAINVKAAVFKAHRPDRLTAQKNLDKHFKHFISQLKKIGRPYGFLVHETEDPDSIIFCEPKAAEESDSFVKDFVYEHSKAIGVVGFLDLKKEWVENSDNLIDFVSDEFCKLYPIYKFFFEEL